MNREGSCHDCGVAPGERHKEGCDVARCKGCGIQALQCHVHGELPMTVWTGVWPGEVEADVLGVDLNELQRRWMRGDLAWDSEAEKLVGREGTP